MQFPERSKKFEWNFNTIVTLGSMIAGLVVTSAGWGITYADLRNGNNDLQKQILEVSNRVDRESIDRKSQLTDMQQQIAQIAPLSFQTTRAVEAGAENKKALELTNNRIDRVVESLGGKLDTAIDSINKVGTQVQVLSSKLEDMQGKADKTIFRTPIVKP
jgi:TolA-binding protein